jgi:hypothetical protein
MVTCRYATEVVRSEVSPHPRAFTDGMNIVAEPVVARKDLVVGAVPLPITLALSTLETTYAKPHLGSGFSPGFYRSLDGFHGTQERLGLGFAP